MKNGARGVWKWPAESVSHCDNRTLGFIKRVPYFSFLAGCYSTKVVVPSITATMYLAKVQCSCWNIFARFLLTLTLQAEILCYKSLQTQTFLKGIILAAQKLACSCCFWLFSVVVNLYGPDHLHILKIYNKIFLKSRPWLSDKANYQHCIICRKKLNLSIECFAHVEVQSQGFNFRTFFHNVHYYTSIMEAADQFQKYLNNDYIILQCFLLKNVWWWTILRSMQSCLAYIPKFQCKICLKVVHTR